jgi:hypothetical protein
VTTWATLRHVVLATGDLAGDGALLRERWGLGWGFTNPGSYLELVAPLTRHTSLARWLAKVGGRGGYALSVQHPDPAGIKERAHAYGVRVIADLKVMGHPVVQLHPADVGVLLELGGITDPDAWLWDDLGIVPEVEALIDDVLGVEIGVPDPVATAVLWANVLDVPRGPQAVEFGDRFVRFVPVTAAPRWHLLLRRAPTGTSLRDETVAGVDVRYI